MVKAIEGILLSSSNPGKLAKFYEQIGIKIGQEYEMGDKGEVFFEMKLLGGSSFYINPHSKIKGKPDPTSLVGV